MGSSQSSELYTHKGVTYKRSTGNDVQPSSTDTTSGKNEDEIEDCLFCRIIENRENDGAPLWYKDDSVAAFIPRSPAARVHILVVPLDHRKNLHSIQPERVELSSRRQTSKSAVNESISDLLEHMHRVAERLVKHALENEEHSGKRKGKATPPGGVILDSSQLALKKINNADAHDKEESSGLLSSVVFDFHRPPFNSIDHLHLHALLPPFISMSDKISFTGGMPWCCSLNEAKEMFSNHE